MGKNGATPPVRPPAPPRSATPQVAPGTDPTRPDARTAQTELHADTAEGANANPNAAAAADKDKPVKGTEAAQIAEQKASLAGISPDQKKAMEDKLKADAMLFSTGKMNAESGGPGGLTEQEAADQRTRNAREMVIKAKALGMDPAQLGMDPRVTEAVEEQQKMVDNLAKQNANLPPGAQQAAEMAARMRAENKGKPQTAEQRKQYEEFLKKNGLDRNALDALPPEQRLLVAGFNPDEIADHFTARDKDADVINDPNSDKNDTAKRGSAGGPVAGGDKNVDGTHRRAMTTDEADRALDINAVLDESWHAADASTGTKATQFGKIVSQKVTSGMMNPANPAYGGQHQLYGDVGEAATTEANPARDGGKATGKEQVQATGLDYNTSEYMKADGKTPADFVENDKVHRLQGDVNKDIENKAEVCLGAGLYGRAQTRAKEMADQQAAAGGDPSKEIYIPKMLRTDSSAATGDTKDGLPGIMMRTRGDAANNTIDTGRKDASGAPIMEHHPEIDPRSGMGYSVTERADMGVVPNQERKMRSGSNLKDTTNVEVSRSDTHNGNLEFNPATGTMTPKASLSDEEKRYYDQLKTNPQGDVAQGRTPA
jgi:hypothetical protein